MDNYVRALVFQESAKKTNNNKNDNGDRKKEKEKEEPYGTEGQESSPPRAPDVAWGLCALADHFSLCVSTLEFTFTYEIDCS